MGRGKHGADFARGKAMGSAAEGKSGSAGGESSVAVGQEDLDNLYYLLEEEKLAGDIYDAFYDQTGLKVFDTISASEDRHFDALLAQAESLGLDTTAILALPDGTYVNEELQALHDALLAQGSVSTDAALAVGVAIEQTDIVDLREAADSVENTALADVYSSLLNGSLSHLDAFEYALSVA